MVNTIWIVHKCVYRGRRHGAQSRACNGHAFTILPYFGKRKQVTYHPNLSYWCFHNSHNELFFQAKFHAETLILLFRYVRYAIMIFHWRQCKWQTHFALLREISLLSLASFCQIRAEYWTIKKQIRINTNQYTIHASCDRVLQSEYIGKCGKSKGLWL